MCMNLCNLSKLENWLSCLTLCMYLQPRGTPIGSLPVFHFLSQPLEDTDVSAATSAYHDLKQVFSEEDLRIRKTLTFSPGVSPLLRKMTLYGTGSSLPSSLLYKSGYIGSKVQCTRSLLGLTIKTSLFSFQHTSSILTSLSRLCFLGGFSPSPINLLREHQTSSTPSSCVIGAARWYIEQVVQ